MRRIHITRFQERELMASSDAIKLISSLQIYYNAYSTHSLAKNYNVKNSLLYHSDLNYYQARTSIMTINFLTVNIQPNSVWLWLELIGQIVLQLLDKFLPIAPQA